ncbi:hypothetical protein D3C72_687990 [compost metagenome]
MQAVVGQLKHADITPYFLTAHLRQRVELVQGALGGGEGAVDFHCRHLAAGARALVAALAGGPGAHGGQLATQRLDLADTAALAVAVLVEAEQALFLDERVELGAVGAEDFDRQVVLLADLVDEPVGLRVQAAGVEAEHLDLLVQLPGHVHQHHVLGAAEGDPQVITEVLEGKLEDVLRGLVGIGRGQGGDVEGLAHQAVSIVAVALCARSKVMVTKNGGVDGLGVGGGCFAGSPAPTGTAHICQLWERASPRSRRRRSQALQGLHQHPHLGNRLFIFGLPLGVGHHRAAAPAANLSTLDQQAANGNRAVHLAAHIHVEQ